MSWLFLSLALQPALEEGPSVPLPCKEPYFLTASATGKFVAVGEAKAVHVLDGQTLGLLAKIDLECTAVGFDERDETFTAVGAALVRLETAGWRETLRGPLMQASFAKKDSRFPKTGIRFPDSVVQAHREGLEPGQALVTPKGEVYYRSKGGQLSVATVEGEAVKSSVLSEGRSGPVEGLEVEGVLAVSGETAVVEIDRITGVVLKGKIYSLAASGEPLAAASFGKRVALVMKEKDGAYDTTSWKCLEQQEAENEAAAFDVKRGWVFASGKGALRAWNAFNSGVEARYGKAAGRFTHLAVDGASTSLYAADAKTLLSWRLKD